MAASATSISLSSLLLQQSFPVQAMLDLPGLSLPLKIACRDRKMLQMNYLKRGAMFKTVPKTGVLFASLTNDSSSSALNPVSVSKTVRQFYDRINEKNLNNLSEFISKDCCIEDFSFPEPFQGAKEVMNFYKQLTSSMGENVIFRIQHVCEGDNLTAAVDWHLEWKGAEIPCTRGCSFYEFTQQEDRLMIKKAQVLIESPIKPGGLALATLKTVVSLFDEFPKPAQRFLQSTEEIFKWVMQIYKWLLRPIVNQVLAVYSNLWKFMTRVLSYAFLVLEFMSKNFFN